MKKRILLFIFVFFVTFLTSCKKSSDIKKIDNALNSINLPSIIVENIDLPSEVDGYDVVWTSSEPDSISNEGIVNLKMEDIIVILTASITVDENTYSKKFEIIVEKDQLYFDIVASLDTLEIPSVLSNGNISLASELNGVKISWTSNNNKIISNLGVVNYQEFDQEVKLKAQVLYKDYIIEKEYNVLVKCNEDYLIINEAIDKLSLVTETCKDITLPKKIDNVTLVWSTNLSKVMTNEGVITRDEEDKKVTLTASFIYNNLKKTIKFDIVVKGYTSLEKMEIVLDEIEFNSDLTSDLVLNKKFKYNINAIWESNNTDVLSNDGEYTYNELVQIVKLKLTLSIGSDQLVKEFVFNVKEKIDMKKDHLIIERANELDYKNFNNLIFKDGKIVLDTQATSGSYISNEIETKEFTSLVASWAATSSTNATVELELKVKVNGVWSDFISYQKWGLGLKNSMFDQTVSLIKLSTDEVVVLNNQKGCCIQYRITLNRSDLSVESPKLSLVAFALEIPNYEYNVDLSNYPKSVIHYVPKLCQLDVPSIGNSICSPTSSTMLLKYKGEDFSSFDTFEHRYIANLFKDYGNNIYGNWAYCAIGMGSFGYDAYVARYYSIEELIAHIATTGPCAISVKGQMNSDKKNYKTNGHLLVVIGYEYDRNDNLVIVCNDPNVQSVECRYEYSVIKDAWRGIIYAIK